MILGFKYHFKDEKTLSDGSVQYIWRCSAARDLYCPVRIATSIRPKEPFIETIGHYYNGTTEDDHVEQPNTAQMNVFYRDVI